MGIYKLLILAGLMISPCGMAKADGGVTGNDLHDWCQSGDSPDQAFCTGYIMGAVHGVQIGQFSTTNCFFSTAEGSTTEQWVDVVKAYMVDHPELRQKQAIALVGAAMNESFPCSK